MSEHRWSGWPGAWCLDCGAEDQRELCAADCSWITEVLAAELDGKSPPPPCSKHQNNECEEPGSNRCNPYYKGIVFKCAYYVKQYGRRPGPARFTFIVPGLTGAYHGDTYAEAQMKMYKALGSMYPGKMVHLTHITDPT